MDELPAEVLARSGKLTLSPAWLAFSSSAGGAPRRAAAGRAPADPLPLPTLPPEPPAGMRPLRPEVVRLLRCEWEAASPAPRRIRRPWILEEE